VLTSLFGLLASIVLGFTTYAQNSISTPFGFHTQTIRHFTQSGQQGNFTLIGSPSFTKGSYTIADVFGINNEFGLSQGDSEVSDKIWVVDNSNGINEWSQIYYQHAFPPFFTEGWRQIGGGDVDVSTKTIPQNASIFLQSGLRSLETVRPDMSSVSFAYLLNVPPCVTYEAKSGTFNFFSRGIPVGISLIDTGIQTSPGYTKSDTFNPADILWLPNGTWNAHTHGYSQFFYTEDFPPFFTEGWKQVGKGNEDMSNILLTSSFAIQTKGPGGEIRICKPLWAKIETSFPGAPPIPHVEVTIDIDLDRFVINWVSASSNIRYSIEAWDEQSQQWLTVLVNDPIGSGVVVYNWASLSALGSAIGRVVSEWILPPEEQP